MHYSVLNKIIGIFIILSVIFLLIWMFLNISTYSSDSLFVLVFDTDNSSELLVTLLSVLIAGMLAIGIYKYEFADDSQRTLDREKMLILSVLAELDEIVRNTWESMDAHLIKYETSKDKRRQLYELARISNNTILEGWVLNKYFSSSLENYLHSGKHLKKEIIYYINRIRKMTELINSYAQNNVRFMQELNLYCYALVGILFCSDLKKITRSISISDYKYLTELKSDFWSNREYMIEMKKIISRIEDDIDKCQINS